MIDQIIAYNKDHKRFEKDITEAVKQLESML